MGVTLLESLMPEPASGLSLLPWTLSVLLFGSYVSLSAHTLLPGT
jgi:hypothetical protein